MTVVKGAAGWGLKSARGFFGDVVCRLRTWSLRKDVRTTASYPATQRAQLRCPYLALSIGRSRSDPDPRHWPYLALRLVAECSTDLSRWRTCHHFTSWLTLAPGCRISGGKVLSAHTHKTKNRVTAHLRLAAVTVGRTNTALGAFYRRLAAQIGKAKAVTATARKIAILFYNGQHVTNA
ncbi:transposase [Pseudomonas chlororaphis]|uniref:transposase n=1 Tax=Pseudomonas chlororaphis TaxID=587753 RepID=UPI0039E3F00E